MNTITIDILPQEIQYIYSNGTWKYEGNSEVSYSNILNLLNRLKLKKLDTNFYSDKKLVDVRVLERNGELISIRLEGMVNCLDEFIEVCYNMAHFFSERFNIKFCVLGENIEFGQYDNYSLIVKKLFNEKINLYMNGHMKEFKYIIPPHKFDKMYKRFLMKEKILALLKKN